MRIYSVTSHGQHAVLTDATSSVTFTLDGLVCPFLSLVQWLYFNTHALGVMAVHGKCMVALSHGNVIVTELVPEHFGLVDTTPGPARFDFVR